MRASDWALHACVHASACARIFEEGQCVLPFLVRWTCDQQALPLVVQPASSLFPALDPGRRSGLPTSLGNQNMTRPACLHPPLPACRTGHQASPRAPPAPSARAGCRGACSAPRTTATIRTGGTLSHRTTRPCTAAMRSYPMRDDRTTRGGTPPWPARRRALRAGCGCTTRSCGPSGRRISGRGASMTGSCGKQVGLHRAVPCAVFMWCDHDWGACATSSLLKESNP